MRRLITTAVLASLLLAGCASDGPNDRVGIFGRMKQGMQAVAHPTIREFARYIVCSLEIGAAGMVLRLSPTGLDSLDCSTERLIPADRLVEEGWDGLGVGAVIEIEDGGAVSLPSFTESTANASSPPKIGIELEGITTVGALKLKKKAPK